MAGDALQHFVSEVGIPDAMVMDNAPELVGRDSESQRTCQQYKIKMW